MLIDNDGANLFFQLTDIFIFDFSFISTFIFTLFLHFHGKIKIQKFFYVKFKVFYYKNITEKFGGANAAFKRQNVKENSE